MINQPATSLWPMLLIKFHLITWVAISELHKCKGRIWALLSTFKTHKVQLMCRVTVNDTLIDVLITQKNNKVWITRCKNYLVKAHPLCLPHIYETQPHARAHSQLPYVVVGLCIKGLTCIIGVTLARQQIKPSFISQASLLLHSCGSLFVVRGVSN